MSVISSPQRLSLPHIEAHIDLLQRYQAQTDNGLWHTLPDDGYIYGHLTWHMEQAQWWDAIHALLLEETPDGRNGWYQSCLNQGHLSTYIQDIQRAWRLAEQSDESVAVSALQDETCSSAMTLQVRYASITSILNSVVSQIPAPLMMALVTHQIWEPEQAWILFQQLTPGEQVTALEHWAADLSESEQNRALEMIGAVQDESSRARMLSVLAPHLGNVHWGQFLKHSQEIPAEHYRALVLRSLSTVLPTDLIPQAMRLIKTITDKTTRLIVLSYWVQHQIDLLPQLLVDLASVQDAVVIGEVLCTLAPHLAPLSLPAVLQICERLQEQDIQGEILMTLAAHHPAVLPQAFAAISELEDEFSCANAFGNLAAYSDQKTLMQILAKVSALQDESARALGLSLLAPYLNKNTFAELWQAIQTLPTEYYRAQVLTHVPHTQDRLPQILEAIESMQDPKAMALAVTTWGAVQPTLMAKALQMAQSIQDPQFRFRVLETLALHQLTIWPAVLEAIPCLPSDFSRAEAIRSLSPHLPQGLMGEALNRVSELSEVSCRSQAISELARYLPRYLLMQALAVVLPVQESSVFGSTARQFDPTRTVAPVSRVSAMNAIASYLPEELLTTTVEVINTIGDPHRRAQALSSLLPQLNLTMDRSQWRTQLRCLAHRRHREFLADLLKLAPAIAQLSGPQTLKDISIELLCLQSQWSECYALRH
ncbi:MAG: hypothetical protein ACFCU8_00265 [Thermosynechococcaceae cyanobacterium]